jgi:hypothetical protein
MVIAGGVAAFASPIRVEFSQSRTTAPATPPHPNSLINYIH